MADRAYQRVLLKISGEGLCRQGGFGIDGEQLALIGAEIKTVVQSGAQLALVVGGGNFIRGQTLAETSRIPRATGDYMGMLGTVINALALQETLELLGLDTRVQSAIAVDRVCEKFVRRRAMRHLDKGRVVILAGGTGNPFVTTDTAAALRGTELNVDIILKATKVDGVYAEDPAQNPQAEFLETLTYDEVIDKRLQIMDVSAIDLCRQSEISIVVFNLFKPGNMLRAIQGEKVGTTITLS